MHAVADHGKQVEHMQELGVYTIALWDFMQGFEEKEQG